MYIEAFCMLLASVRVATTVIAVAMGLATDSLKVR